MPKFGRKVWTIQVRFITGQVGLAELVEMANVYCQSSQGHSARFRPIRKGATADVSMNMMQRQKGYKCPKLAAIQEMKLLEENSRRPEPDTVQFKLFEGSELGQLEQEVNRFCLTVEAQKADIQFDEETGKWAVIITYGSYLR
ncbi:MAG: hypothetical protein WCW26_05315 [Candidatus Buchananbacteria bacterium]